MILPKSNKVVYIPRSCFRYRCFNNHLTPSVIWLSYHYESISKQRAICKNIPANTSYYNNNPSDRYATPKRLFAQRISGNDISQRYSVSRYMYLAFVCFIWYRRYPSKNVAVGIPRGFREMRRSRAESTYIYEYLCSDEPWGPLWLHFRRWGGYWSRLPAFLHAYQQVEKKLTDTPIHLGAIRRLGCCRRCQFVI